ncbi:anthranilate synthase component I family protein [Olivibacter ginsenosidimutans]|uniref:Anthranilate synthase component I family protein n=1 Tax=Olivibacter ginsenosidimutans TaxID=1176537 RepID=A0ABP9C6I2_9SPHI
MLTAEYFSENIQQFTKQALQWASLFNSACCFHSHGSNTQDPYRKFDILLAAGVTDELFPTPEQPFFTKLKHFIAQHPHQWIPGFLAYDLKNELETLQTNHPNEQGIPDAYFFVPKHLIQINGNQISINSNEPAAVFQQIQSIAVIDNPFSFSGKVQAKMTKKAYKYAFKQLLEHIHRGDIYEVNLCQEFFAEQVSFSPLEAYWQLSTISPTPFSCYFKVYENHLLCASPERFLAKRQQLLISQPIKGTAARGNTPEEDQQCRDRLRANQKEISENIMIVDLVRNDLTRSAQPASVRVNELLGVYTFQQVHQLISTITAQEKPGLHPLDSIQATFPAGSMTGAPKINAMKLIDTFESSSRGLYAGSIGYFAPDGDYDFNVVIRTLFFNEQKKRISFHVGGALTAEAQAEEEYQECLLKAKAIMELLGFKV